MPRKRVPRPAQSYKTGKNKPKQRRDSNIFARHNWQVKVNHLSRDPGLDKLTFEQLRTLEDECLTLHRNSDLTGLALRSISKIQYEIKQKEAERKSK